MLCDSVNCYFVVDYEIEEEMSFYRNGGWRVKRQPPGRRGKAPYL
jgi:hypothetical protein